jgi:invasion protein IalB
MFTCNKDAAGDCYGVYGKYVYCITPLAVRLFLIAGVQWQIDDKIASVLTFINCHKPLACVELPDDYDYNNIEALQALLAHLITMGY